MQYRDAIGQSVNRALLSNISNALETEHRTAHVSSEQKGSLGPKPEN